VVEDNVEEGKQQERSSRCWKDFEIVRNVASPNCEKFDKKKKKNYVYLFICSLYNDAFSITKTI
jgi:hypothetical protein